MVRCCVLVAIVALAPACGGGSSSADLLAFRKRANAICLGYHHRLARLGAPTTLPRIARVARGAARLGAQERKALRALDAPDAAAAEFGQMLDGFDRADRLLPGVRRSARRKDATRTLKLVKRGRALVAAANVHANALGLTECRRD